MAGEEIEKMKDDFLKMNSKKDEDKKEKPSHLDHSATNGKPASEHSRRRDKSDKMYSVGDIRKRTVFKKSFCHLDRTTEE